MGNNTTIPIETANLDRDTQTSMLRNSGLENWAIMFGDRDSRLAEDFMVCLRESIEYCKFQCKPPRPVTVNSNRLDDWMGAIKTVVANF